MTPLPGGRFCRHCEKTVVDFTRMTDRDIARLYLRREGRVCGHFRQDQLNKRLPLPASVSRWQKFRAIGALLSGLLLSGAAAAQTALQKPLIIVPSIGQKPGLQTASRLLKGIVTDEAGEPLIGAAIALAAADGPGRILAGTASLADGRFELKIPERAKQFHLTISYLGYEEQILELSPAELAGNQAIQVQLKAASYNLEEVQVIAYNSSMTSTMGLISGVAVVHKGKKNRKKSWKQPPKKWRLSSFSPIPSPPLSMLNSTSLSPAACFFTSTTPPENWFLPKPENYPKGSNCSFSTFPAATCLPVLTSLGFPMK